jgi:hypothetical protein
VPPEARFFILNYRSAAQSINPTFGHRRCPLRVRSGHGAIKLQCPLYPQQRTFLDAIPMPDKGHLRTSANLFDHVARTACVGRRSDFFGDESHRHRGASGIAWFCPVRSGVMRRTVTLFRPVSWKWLVISSIELPGDVSYGSKADVTLSNFDVRLTLESGHSPTRSGCLLWAISRHSPHSFNDVVGAGKQRGRNCHAQCFRRFEIDDQYRAGRCRWQWPSTAACDGSAAKAASSSTN